MNLVLGSIHPFGRLCRYVSGLLATGAPIAEEHQPDALRQCRFRRRVTEPVPPMKEPPPDDRKSDLDDPAKIGRAEWLVRGLRVVLHLAARDLLGEPLVQRRLS